MGLFAKSITVIALAGAASIANANLLTNGDFESNVGLTGHQWHVFNSIDGWDSSSSNGIEVQRNTVIAAESGNQYVELDTNNNSQMYQAISGLNVGQTYNLDFWYHARTNNGGNDNGINVYWGDTKPGDLQLSISDVIHNDTPGWVEYSTNLLASAETMYLTFSAEGISNSLGGFIDNASVSSVPEPSSIALFAIGLLGLIFSRRRVGQA